jgi:hypothetical protein
MPVPPKRASDAKPKRKKKSAQVKPQTTPTKLRPGDLYAYALPDGRYGAVRVLAVKGSATLVVHTAYLGAKRPWRDDPPLRNELLRQRFDFGGTPALAWLDGKPEGTGQTCVGHIELSDAEREQALAALDARVPKHGWRNIYPEAHAEWRWAHDRAAFELETSRDAEVRLREQRQKRIPAQSPRDPMPDRSFWKLMALHSWTAKDDDAAIAPVVADLAMGSERRVIQFAETLAHKLYLLDTRAHAEHIGDQAFRGDGKPFSPEAFLDARCMVVAKGEANFQRVLQDPSKIQKNAPFDALLSISVLAWELITGDSPEWGTACNIETFSNAAGWR